MSFLGTRNAVSIGVSQHVTMGGPNLLNKLSPSLLLTFAGAQTLDSRITFTRATTATFTGSNGLIQTAAIDAPRFDYNPTTLAPLGLLIEEQRTNLLLNTSVLGTQVVTVTAAAHTLSFYGTGTIVLSGAFTGTVTGTGAYPTRTILTFTPIVGVLTVTVTGSVTSAQLEAGAFPTSYIPTVASQVTRSADVAVMTGTNFSSWYNQTEGTVYFESKTDQGSNAYPYSLFGTSTANRIFANYATLNRMNSGIRIGGTFDASVNTPSDSAPINTFGKGATAYKVNDFGFSWNGAAALTDTSTTLPTILALYIGSNGGLATNFLNGHIRKIAFWPKRVSNAQLQGLTS